MLEHDFPEFVITQTIPKMVRKGEILLRNGDTDEYVFYVESGCLKSYTIDDKGKEHIFQFAPEGWVITDHASIVNKEPARLNISAIEDSLVRFLKIPSVDNHFESLNKEQIVEMNYKLMRRIAAHQNRIIQLLSSSAEDRYNSFNKTYPNLALRLPQKMIASYLGITPESLSRVRKEMTTKKSSHFLS
jgi:CRP-like cAMP-binding protein